MRKAAIPTWTFVLYNFCSPKHLWCWDGLRNQPTIKLDGDIKKNRRFYQTAKHLRISKLFADKSCEKNKIVWRQQLNFGCKNAKFQNSSIKILRWAKSWCVFIGPKIKISRIGPKIKNICISPTSFHLVKRLKKPILGSR